MEALKEERAELKHTIYLLEKEKRALELKMNSRDAQEQAYVVHIEHLKSEVKEQMRKRKQLLKESSRKAQYSVMVSVTKCATSLPKSTGRLYIRFLFPLPKGLLMVL